VHSGRRRSSGTRGGRRPRLPRRLAREHPCNPAELGDFDATSTTIALSPGGEQARLPEPLLLNTFERYWREFVQRRDGKREWKDYTPYELRTVGSFVRLDPRHFPWVMDALRLIAGIVRRWGALSE